jgi:hypothetical protein
MNFLALNIVVFLAMSEKRMTIECSKQQANEEKHESIDEDKVLDLQGSGTCWPNSNYGCSKKKCRNGNKCGSKNAYDWPTNAKCY